MSVVTSASEIPKLDFALEYREWDAPVQKEDAKQERR